MSKNAKVGIFIIGGALLFTAGLFFMGNHNQVFQHHYDMYTEFAKVDTLQSGAKIRVSGMDAGEVSDIELPRQPSAKFRLKLHVDEKFKHLIRQDSVASIETEGMVGNKYVDIAKGSNRSPECDGCIIRGEEPVEIGDLLRQAQGIAQTAQGTLTDLQHRADIAMSNVDQMIVSVRPNVERIASNGAQITGNVNSLVSGVQAGRGTVGKLLTDAQMADNVETTISNAQRTSAYVEQASNNANQVVAQLRKEDIPEDLHETVANAKDMSQELKTALGDFLHGPPNAPPHESTAENIRETIDDAHRATRNLASDTEAIKHNFFLRGFFHRRGFYNLTDFNPTSYAKSNFVKHPRKRIWLSADAMFTKSSDGAIRLSPEGRSELDRAVSQLADELPNNPVMVEGYAEAGSPAERYVTARERANEVKKYLQARFQLKPDLVGFIPLGDKPPDGTGQGSWNGICLAMVVSRK